VLLYRPQPVDCKPYRRFFRTRSVFGAECSAAVFSASWLDRKLDGTDALVHRRIMQKVESPQARGAGDLVTQLRRVLRRRLVVSARQGETHMEQIADLFGMYRRTLNRRLRARWTSFRVLVDEARYDIARQLLRDAGLPVSDIAAALDYSECSAFVRAFRRWSGTSPTAWRAENASYRFQSCVRSGHPPAFASRPARSSLRAVRRLSLNVSCPCCLLPTIGALRRNPGN
jgi:AraC-like DNA-binding protein